MRIHRPASTRRGFSLIEVLIAVVVLSVGLLALAALQSSLIRYSADAKAQSVALSLAKETLENMRSYQSMDEFRALTSLAVGSAETIDDDGLGRFGGVDFRRWWTVVRYAFNETNGTFEVVDNTAALDPDTYPQNNEFKTVTVNVAWTSATGAQQTVVLQDAIGALSPMDSSNLQANRGVRPRGPQVLIHDPSSEAGVIPIAIGNNTETAATNPRPEIAGRNNSPRAVETRFDVLTYAALTGNNAGLALAQARVETTVVGCTCDTATGGGTVRGFRPTYWNGERYVPPSQAGTYFPPAGHAQLGNNDPPESALCTACCRDHHDPIGIAGPKFSPTRVTHEHYRSTDLSTVIGSGRYDEACRLIRVDGIFRVAADMYNDYFGLLETSSETGVPLRSPVPSATATANYQDFALAYLGDRFVTGTGYNSPANGNATTHEFTFNLNAPVAAVDFFTTVNDYRWLHARGLYVDYLEQEAIDAIQKAKDDCATQQPSPCTTEELRTAVLARLPFTSINLTEIANWTPATSGTQNLVVTNLDFVQSVNSTDPVRGKVLRGSSPSDGATATATASVLRSNSGVALLLGPINPDEATPLTDPNNQDFRIVGVATGGGSYTVTMNNYPFTNSAADLPTIVANPLATCNYNRTNNPNPYTCTATAVDVAATLQVSNYNFAQEVRISDSFSCSGPNGVVTAALSNARVNRCRNFSITAVTAGGTVGTVTNEGAKSETTQISFASLANNAAVSMTFTEQASTYSYVCTYTVRNNGSYDYTVSPASCPQ